VEALDLDKIESAVEWFEGQYSSQKDVNFDDLMLRSAKKLTDVSSDIRQLAFQTFVGRKQVQSYAPNLAKGYFTKSGLEQRTHPAIANYRAKSFSPNDVVIEIGCGLGFDTAALSKVVNKIFCFELDPIHAAFAKYNLSIQGILNVEIIHDDFENINNYESIINSATAVYADPARRTKLGQKVKSGADYSPSLDRVIDFASKFETASIKVSPIYKQSHLGFFNEWIGFDKECKERILWKTKNHNNFDRVTIINNDHVPSTLLLENKNFATPIQVETVEDLLDGYVLFPHAALLASDQTQIFASLNNLELFPPDTMLLFSKNTPSNSLFYDSFKVIDIKPYDIKKLATYIEQLNWNSNTELKKKNFPIEPESLRAKLKLLPYSESNTQSGTVIFTQFNKQQIIIFSKRQ
jgi:hypothetical protein